MEKLDKKIKIVIPEELREEIESQGLDFKEELIVKIYYLETMDEDGVEWNRYRLVFNDDEYEEMRINALAIKMVQELNYDDYPVEIFIYEQLMECIYEENEKQEVRHFLDEISD